MATQTTGGGSTTSFTNTPQAKDDYYTTYEDCVEVWDVMANDLGGSAKILWSIDDTAMKDDSGTGTYDLLTQDTAASIPEKSDLGALISIQNGMVKYDASTLDFLAAGETAVDKFTYAIRLANGTLAWATVYVTVTGTNDLPTIVGVGTDATGSVTEKAEPDEGGTLSDSGTIAFADVDLIDTHSASVGTTVKDGNGNTVASPLGSLSLGAVDQAGNTVVWTFTVDDSAVDHLAAGQTLTQVYTVTISDNHGGSVTQNVIVTITGTNDAPTVSAAVSSTSNEDAAGYSVDLLAGADDVDASDTLNVTGLTLVSGDASGITANGNSLDVDPSAYNHLAVGESAVITYSYQVSDGNGGTVAQTATITIEGRNDAPVVVNAIANQSVDEDNAWSHQVPANAFGDIDGDTLTYDATLAGGAELPGWLSFDPSTRTFSGTPPQDFNGTISVTVTASDGSLSASDTFDLVINPVNDAPVATPVVLAAIAEDSGTRIITQAELLAGASDIEGDLLTITALSIASGGGMLVANPDGTWSYTPAADDDTSVTFNYTVSDGDLTAVSTASLDITPVDDATPYVSPPVYNGPDADPNDFDSLGNPAGENISNQATNGDDTLYGGAGADTINGGSGDDIIYGGSGGDSLNGGNDGDELFGGSGNDVITGSNDDDRLIGGYGADTLTGSNGADTFVYLSQRDTGDRITDFSQSQGDKIEFAASFGFDSSDFVGVLSSAGAVGAGQFGYLYNSATNTTTIYVDTDGVAGADMEIHLTGNVNLTSGDFLFGAP